MAFNRSQQIAMANRVGILTVDQTQLLTINVLGNPVAQIAGIRVLDIATGIWYSVYPEGQPAYCTPGISNLVISYGVNNVGALDGVLYGKIINSNGQTIHSDSAYVPVGEMAYWEPIFDMTAQNMNLTIEVGH